MTFSISVPVGLAFGEFKLFGGILLSCFLMFLLFLCGGLRIKVEGPCHYCGGLFSIPLCCDLGFGYVFVFIYLFNLLKVAGSFLVTVLQGENHLWLYQPINTEVKESSQSCLYCSQNLISVLFRLHSHMEKLTVSSCGS